MFILVATLVCAAYPWRLLGSGRTVMVAPGRFIWYGPAQYGLGLARGVCLTPKPLDFATQRWPPQDPYYEGSGPDALVRCWPV